MTAPIPGPYTVDHAKAAISSPSGIICLFTEWGDADQATARVMVEALNAQAQVARLKTELTDSKITSGQIAARNFDYREALRKCLNFIENTESELGVKLSCGDAARDALGRQP